MVKYSRAPQNATPKVREEWRRFDKSVRRLIENFFYNCLAVNEKPALPNWRSLLAANPRIPALLGGHVSAAVCQAFWARCTSLFAKLVNRYGAIRAMGALRDPASNWRACFLLLWQILRSF
jgi:hypothetical protein